MAHRWRFFRAGGFDQVRIDSGEDIRHLAELDPKLWVALSCPVKGLEFDAHTLQLLDTDADGRIRVPEVVAAAKWASALLKNPDDLIHGREALPLDAIDDRSEEGKQVLASARQLLRQLHLEDSKTIAPKDLTDTVQLFARTLFNGDGVVPPAAAEEDQATAQAIREIMECVGAVKDLSGLEGVDRAKVDQFFEEATQFVDWAAQSGKQFDAAAFDAYQAVHAKVDDYFARCALAAMDGRVAEALNPSEQAYGSLAGQVLGASSEVLQVLPLARVTAESALPLREGLNPAWRAPITRLRDACVKPLLGERDRLTRGDWDEVSTRLSAQHAWYASQPRVAVEKLGLPRLRELTQGSSRAAIETLIAKDKALEPTLKAITSVDRLVHYHRDLAKFLNNFVAFRDFYTHRAKSIFQMGTLFLDGRSCDLCLHVEDSAKHLTLAGRAMTYLAYCDVTRQGGKEKMHISAAFTVGDSDFVMVGRNGVFFDRRGADWDATVTHIVEQPISVGQAFWLPYKKVARFVEDQINRIAGSKHEESMEGAKQVAQGKDVSAFDISKFAGVFAAVGLGVGMLGSAVAAILTGFLGLKIWQMPLAIGGALLVLSGPSMLLAAMKLRQRNLGPLLDACGWAINARAMINIPFGASLTQLATLPPGSERSFSDPFAQKRQPIALYVFLALVVGAAVWLWRAGYIERWLYYCGAHLK